MLCIFYKRLLNEQLRIEEQTGIKFNQSGTSINLQFAKPKFHRSVLFDNSYLWYNSSFLLLPYSYTFLQGLPFSCRNKASSYLPRCGDEKEAVTVWGPHRDFAQLVGKSRANYEGKKRNNYDERVRCGLEARQSFRCRLSKKLISQSPFSSFLPCLLSLENCKILKEMPRNEPASYIGFSKFY